MGLNISDTTALFVRYSQDAFGQAVVPSLWSGSNYDTVVTHYLIPTKSAVLHLTHSFKPSLMNEFMLTYGNDPHTIYATAGASSPAGSILKPTDWSVVPLFAANASQTTLPGISVGGGVGVNFQEAANQFTDYHESEVVVTLKDNVVYVLGKHTLKFGIFGVNFRGFSILNQTAPEGFFSFSGGGPLTTGNALADMYLGRINSYTEGSPYNYITGVATGGFGETHGHFGQWEPYVEDDWKASRRLTLNVGLRYSYNIPYHESNSNPRVDTTFVPSLYNPADAPKLNAQNFLIPGSGQFYTTPGNGVEVCATGGIPQGCMYPDRFTWAPRLSTRTPPLIRHFSTRR